MPVVSLHSGKFGLCHVVVSLGMLGIVVETARRPSRKWFQSFWPRRYRQVSITEQTRVMAVMNPIYVKCINRRDLGRWFDGVVPSRVVAHRERSQEKTLRTVMKFDNQVKG